MTPRAYVPTQLLLICTFSCVALLTRQHVVLRSPVLSYAGDVMCAAGITLLLAAAYGLREVLRISPEPKGGGSLVTSGVYRWFRHPMYTAIVLAVMGVWLREPSAALAMAGCALVAFLLAKARFEERLLAERYPYYRAYRAGTWGVIPGRLNVRSGTR